MSFFDLFRRKNKYPKSSLESPLFDEYSISDAHKALRDFFYIYCI